MRYEHVLQHVRETPWAILPDKMAIILDLLTFRAQGGELSAEEIREITGAAPRSQGRVTGSIAVLPLHGVIVQRAGFLSDLFGDSSTERFGALLRQTLADPSIGAVVIDVDSPGGSVYGVQELADEIFAARGPKPIVAVANSMAASAAYWLATQADDLVVTPSGEVGSIGIIAAHQDVSVALEQAGVKMTLVSAGKYKAESNPFVPLGEDARAAIQSRVDDHYAVFVNAVARGRGVRPSAVRGGFGEGRVVGARQAVDLGMADRVATLEQTIAKLGGSRARRSGGRAEDDRRRLLTMRP